MVGQGWVTCHPRNHVDSDPPGLHGIGRSGGSPNKISLLFPERGEMDAEWAKQQMPTLLFYGAILLYSPKPLVQSVSHRRLTLALHQAN